MNDEYKFYNRIMSESNCVAFPLCSIILHCVDWMHFFQLHAESSNRIFETWQAIKEPSTYPAFADFKMITSVLLVFWIFIALFRPTNFLNWQQSVTPRKTREIMSGKDNKVIQMLENLNCIICQIFLQIGKI